MTIDLGDASQWNNFRASIDLGVDHIRTGPDHVFFILALLLPAVLILVAWPWKPSPSFGYSLLRIVLVATMFTIAHSITFTLAGLDYLPLPPSKLTESVIALSIMLAALHNLRPILGHREWLLAFVFGLFHGMGFAGLVEDLDINRTTQLVSLLGRNVGIEIAQLVIIFVTFPLLFLLRRTRAYMPLFTLVSLALAAVSAVWIVERGLRTRPEDQPRRRRSTAVAAGVLGDARRSPLPPRCTTRSNSAAGGCFPSVGGTPTPTLPTMPTTARIPTPRPTSNPPCNAEG